MTREQMLQAFQPCPDCGEAPSGIAVEGTDIIVEHCSYRLTLFKDQYVTPAEMNQWDFDGTLNFPDAVNNRMLGLALAQWNSTVNP